MYLRVSIFICLPLTFGGLPPSPAPAVEMKRDDNLSLISPFHRDTGATKKRIRKRNRTNYTRTLGRHTKPLPNPRLFPESNCCFLREKNPTTVDSPANAKEEQMRLRTCDGVDVPATLALNATSACGHSLMFPHIPRLSFSKTLPPPPDIPAFLFLDNNSIFYVLKLESNCMKDMS